MQSLLVVWHHSGRKKQPDSRARSLWGEGDATTSLDLAKPPEAADVDCNNSVLVWSVWSTASLLSNPCHWKQELELLNKTVPTATVPPDRCQLIVSKTESIMNTVMMQKQLVISIVIVCCRQSAQYAKTDVSHWLVKYPQRNVWCCSVQSCLNGSDYSVLFGPSVGMRIKTQDGWDLPGCALYVV